MSIIGAIKQWGADFTSVIYPKLCEVCGTSLAHGETMMCTECRMRLPRCNIHTQPFNHIHQRLAGHAPIERAAGYFYYYRENEYTNLIHSAKYNGRPWIAEQLARDFATEIMPDGFFDDIDLILPVPLHASKLRKRGYNQSRHIAIGLHEVTSITIGDNLIATREHSTQTRRGAFERWLNSRNIYDVVQAETLADKHLLIVDDVLTTGATLLACCEAVHAKAPTARISVLTLAVAHLR